MRQLGTAIFVSGQIRPQDMPALASAGVTAIVNNRPDGEEPDQPEAAEIEAAARKAGLGYRHIPVGSAGFSANQVEAMAQALQAADGKLLAFCRSGTRSTYLWALAEAGRGEDADGLARQAAAAGYDLNPILPLMASLGGGR